MQGDARIVLLLLRELLEERIHRPGVARAPTVNPLHEAFERDIEEHVRKTYIEGVCDGYSQAIGMINNALEKK